MNFSTAPLDDRMVIAWYGENGNPAHTIYDFKRSRPGSDRRYSYVGEYKRHIEALQGQGCEVFAWSPKRWSQRRQSFYEGKYRGTKICKTELK